MGKKRKSKPNPQAPKPGSEAEAAAHGSLANAGEEFYDADSFHDQPKQSTVAVAQAADNKQSEAPLDAEDTAAVNLDSSAAQATAGLEALPELTPMPDHSLPANGGSATDGADTLSAAVEAPAHGPLGTASAPEAVSPASEEDFADFVEAEKKAASPTAAPAPAKGLEDLLAQLQLDPAISSAPRLAPLSLDLLREESLRMFEQVQHESRLQGRFDFAKSRFRKNLLDAAPLQEQD